VEWEKALPSKPEREALPQILPQPQGTAYINFYTNFIVEEIRRNDVLNLNPKFLAGYCGLYCGACAIYQGKIKQAVENLRSLIKAYGFDKFVSELARWNPAFKHYREFEEVMKAFEETFGECPACMQGGGAPQCQI